ncbi:MAG TPA: gas vesicle protein GvpG [Rectinemataceae bacterium]|nr:gas vesicle protein GvpG [Rectinemataceae bacterium]
MLLVDDILLFPFRSLMWIFREIDNAVEEDIAAEPEAITAKLGELYMMLETGQMTEAEFDAAEKVLLDRLDVLKGETSGGEEE